MQEKNQSMRLLLSSHGHASNHLKPPEHMATKQLVKLTLSFLGGHSEHRTSAQLLFLLLNETIGLLKPVRKHWGQVSLFQATPADAVAHSAPGCSPLCPLRFQNNNSIISISLGCCHFLPYNNQNLLLHSNTHCLKAVIYCLAMRSEEEWYF